MPPWVLASGSERDEFRSAEGHLCSSCACSGSIQPSLQLAEWPNSLPSHCPKLGRRADSVEASVAILRCFSPEGALSPSSPDGLLGRLHGQKCWKVLRKSESEPHSDPLLSCAATPETSLGPHWAPPHLPPKEPGVIYSIVFGR